MSGLGLAGYVCLQCGRTLGTADDLDRLIDEAGDPLDPERTPGWAVDRCWRRLEVACTRRPKWASDAKITLARQLFYLYVFVTEDGAHPEFSASSEPVQPWHWNCLDE